MKKIGSMLFLILMMTQTAWSAVSIKAELYPEEVAVGDQARLILTISSEEDFEIQGNPDFPTGSGFKILQAQNAGRSSSSRMNIINGKTDFSKTVMQNYEYILQFDQKGFVTIPSISVQVNGSVSATAPIKVSVSASPSPGRQRQRQRQLEPDQGVDDDMFSQLMKQRQKILEEVQRQMGGRGQGGGFGAPDPFGIEPQEVPNLKLNNVNTNEAFFVYADTDKSTVYEGEQITTNWYIYVKGLVEAIDRAKFPELKGFWKEIIEEVPGLTFTPAVVNGIPYKRALLASHALFPIKAGVSVIDEFKIKATVRLQTEFGWGQPHEFTKSSRRMPINVLPLPTEGKPLSFSGAVGQFQIQTQVDGLQVKAGQPFALKVRFEGQGNAKLIELPPIEWPSNLTVFDTKSESKFFKNGQSYKQFEILLIPHQEGPLKIPLITFSYFDPQQKKYVTKTTEELQLTAIKSDQPLPNNLGRMASGDLTKSNAEKFELAPTLDWPGSFSWLAQRNLFFSLTALIILVFLSVQFGWEFKKIVGTPTLKFKVSEKIKKIDSALKLQDIKNVGSESINLIYLVLEGLNSETDRKNLNSQDIAERLNQLPLHYREKYQVRLNEIFNYFQMIGFAPDEVRINLTRQKNIDTELSDLKTICHELAEDLERST